MVIRRTVLRLVGFPDEYRRPEERTPKLMIYYMYLAIRCLCYFRYGILALALRLLLLKEGKTSPRGVYP